MSATSIPVDLFNPGQVFACLGFLEVADRLLGNAEGGFGWDARGKVRFTLSADGDRCPVREVLAFVRDASFCAVSPTPDVQERDGNTTSVMPGVHPCKLADEKGKVRSALLPVSLSLNGRDMLVSSWTDFDSGREVLQLWTATNGNSASVRFSKLHAAYKAALAKAEHPEKDPFNLPAAVAANFRLELRRNWTAINLGFSPDKINKGSGCVPIELTTYPVVELLAAIGLNETRPVKLTKLEWAYSVWGVPLPPALARAALGGGLLPETCRRFRMVLEEPNDGGDLSIADAFEELTP
jgi:CRISPR-associated protein Csx14